MSLIQAMPEEPEDFTGKRVDRYLLSSLLGCGAAGNVYQAVDITLDHSPIFAIKCVRGSNDTRRRHQQVAEIDNHDAVACCPNVMMLFDFFEENDHLFLVFPLCETDLFRAIWKEQVYWRNDALIKEAFVAILDGVFACHRKGIYHRDLKPENIMCNAQGKEVKISDFGLSSDRRVCRDGGCGTAPYMSPECADEKCQSYYAEPVDIWSLGVILFNMYMAFVTKKDYFLRTSPISEPLNMLFHQIWHPTPLRRLSIPALREAILEIDTFYRPRRKSSSSLSKEALLPVVDSQQTCVAPAEDKKEKDLRTPSDDILEEIPLSLSRLNLNSKTLFTL